MVGNRTRVKVVKNKCAPPFRQAEFDIMYGKGISREGSVLDLGVDLGVVEKSGAWYTYGGEQLGQGRENSKRLLAESPELMVEISDRIWREVAPAEPEIPVVDEATGEIVESGGEIVESDGASHNGASHNGAFSEADDLPISLDS